MKDDLLEFGEDFHDIDNFYKTQKPVWEKLIKAHAKFDLNKFELEKDDDTRVALQRMKEILQSKAPYGIIQEAEALINKVDSVNNSLISAYRTAAVKKIESLIDELDRELTTAQADEAFRNSSLRPLVDLKGSVQQMDSIAHLQQIEQRAASLFEQQTQAIADYVENAAKENKDDTPKPVVKSIVSVRSSSLVTKSYLETQADVDDFVGKLKDKLSAEIANNKRVRIE
ncbi:hypothetical protein ACFL3Q_03600 [Planctomycetota bacterium]